MGVAEHLIGHHLRGRKANWTVVERLEDFCARRGHGLLELAFSWLKARPCVASVIAGATKAEQVEQNVAAVSWALTPDDLAEIARLSRPPDR